MALPKIEYPIYNLILPSTGKKINYRPFLVKEEKLFLMAALSEDSEEVKNTIIQIINNCILSEDFNIKNAPVFDVEFILLNLRIRSIGGVIKNEYTCNNEIDGTKCGNEFKLDFDLNSIKVIKEKTDDEFMLTDKIGIKMKWPRFATLKKKDKPDAFDYDVLADSVDYVFDDSGTHKFREQTKEEITQFFDSLNKDQFQKILDYLNKLPKFEMKKEHKCEKCGFNHVIEVNDLTSFF